VLQRGAAEIGMHLHAWNSPPIVPLTDNDYRHQPYLIEYPADIMREKVHVLTEILHEAFDCDLASHRAGRWAFDERYARVLLHEGYQIDCSVTPHVDWTPMHGGGRGGSDYRGAPEAAYFISVSDITKPGNSTLLEVPMTTRPVRRSNWANRVLDIVDKVRSRQVRRVRQKLWPAVHWLRPTGHNVQEMLGLLDRVVAEEASHAVLMLHSSELMPGGSPRFPSARSIQRLYEDLEAVFEKAEGLFLGKTLAEFAQGRTAAEQKTPNGVLHAAPSWQQCVKK
jgi:hypothetical protein